MKVYVDAILMINFWYDFLILCSVSILLKRHASLKHILFGTLIGASSMCTLFLELNKYVLIFYDFITSLVMVVITFGPHNIKDNLFYFYIITIIIGGSQYLLTGNAYEVNILTMMFISPVIIFLYVKSQKEYKLKYTKYHSVILIDGREAYSLTGYMDTGNTLLEPLTKKPVILVRDTISLKGHNEFLVPYKVVNHSSILKCLSIDKILINNKEIDAYVGLVDRAIFNNGIDVILNERLRDLI